MPADFRPYAEGFDQFDKVKTYGRQIQQARDIQVTDRKPVSQEPTLESAESFQARVDNVLDLELEQEKKYETMPDDMAFKQGYNSTLTEALSRAYDKEFDPNFEIGEEQEALIKQAFPNGLDERGSKMLYKATSMADFKFRLDKLTQEQEFAKYMSQQTGISKFGQYAELFAGTMLDPIALPLGSFGLAPRVLKGGSLLASTGRMGLEGAAAMGVMSPVIQQIDKGSVDGGEVLQHMATGAVFNMGIGVVGRMAGFNAHEPYMREQETAMNEKIHQEPEYVNQAVKDLESGDVVDFRQGSTVEGPAGETVATGPSAVMRAAESWNESKDVLGKTATAREAYYKNKFRKALGGWADTEGVKLALSESKVARFVGSMWSGDQAGIGKQYARNAAVQKELIKDQLMWDTIPDLKRNFEMYLTPQQKLDYLAGGGKEAQATFSREVQLERMRHRAYRAQNNGSSDGYLSGAPASVQGAARTLDRLAAQTKDLHLSAGTEHASIMKDMDSVGYMPQKANYSYLNKASPEVRKAHLEMLKEEYRLDAEAQIKKMVSEKEQWLDKAYKRAEQQLDQPWVNEFLNNPDAYFEKSMDELSKRILREMETRASRYWDNALKDPNARYQSSEATLLQLAREMSAEHFTGRYVDEDIVKTFADNLTKKWSDTSRREMNMLNKRNVNGKDVYMLDMFEHDVFGTASNTINSTAGRVAMARLGWKTEQDIQDTLQALRISGATNREVEAAQFIADTIIGRQPALDDTPLARAVSNLTHSSMMGKLGMSVLADLPTAIGNLGLGGVIKAMGPRLAEKVTDGSMFVRNGKLTQVGNDLEFYMRGLFGHDNELWIPQGVTADGAAMEAGASLVRRTEAASRITNTLSGANAVNKLMQQPISKEIVSKFTNYFKTGKGFNEKRLADVGLYPEDIVRIKAQFDKHGRGNMFGLDKWNDPVAKESLIGAVHRYTQQATMNRQYAGEQVKFERTSMLGVLYSRFRSIGIRAQEKVLIRNLTLADSNSVAMFTTGIAWATFLAYARIHMDAASSKDPKQVLKDRLTPLGIADQVGRLSSVMGLASEGTNLLQMITGGGYKGGGDTPFTSTVSSVTGAVSALGEAATGEGDWGKAGQKAIRLLPGGNTYQMMLLQRALDD